MSMERVKVGAWEGVSEQRMEQRTHERGEKGAKGGRVEERRSVGAIRR
jgi:hypothetical protein